VIDDDDDDDDDDDAVLVDGSRRFSPQRFALLATGSRPACLPD